MFCSKVLFSIFHSNNQQGTGHTITENEFSTSNIFLPHPSYSHILLWFLSATSLGKSCSLFSSVYNFCSYFSFLSIFSFLFEWDPFLPAPWIRNPDSPLFLPVLQLFLSLGHGPSFVFVFGSPFLGRCPWKSGGGLWDGDRHKFDSRPYHLPSTMTLASHFHCSQSLDF